MGFTKKVNGTATYCNDSVESIDFGGLAIEGTSEVPAYKITKFLSDQANLKYIERLVINMNNSSVPIEVCSNCKTIEYANISGNVTCSSAQLFDKCSNLKRVNLNNFNLSTNNLSKSFNGDYRPNGGFPVYDGSLLELDISSFNGSNITNLTQFLNG